MISPQTKLKPEEKGTSDQHGTSRSYVPHALSGREAAAFLPRQLFLLAAPSGPSPPTTTCCQTPCLHTTRSTPTCTGQIPAPHRQLLVRPAGHRAGCGQLCPSAKPPPDLGSGRDPNTCGVGCSEVKTRESLLFTSAEPLLAIPYREKHVKLGNTLPALISVMLLFVFEPAVEPVPHDKLRALSHQAG